MHKADLREQTRKAAEKRKKKMGTRLSKGEKKTCKRIATAGKEGGKEGISNVPKVLVIFFTIISICFANLKGLISEG